MSDAKKKILGLFRSRTAPPEKSSKDSRHENKRPRRRRDRPAASSDSPHGSVRRSHRRHSPATEPRKSTGSYVSTRSHPVPLTAWPPLDSPTDGDLTQGKAMELIASGVPVFKGHRRDVPHTSNEYYTLYATCEGNGGAGSDQGEPYNATFSVASFRLQGPGPAEHPWETLEQPSMAFYYGARPGTITLNHWISLSGKPNPQFGLRDPGVKPREVDLSTILERLIYLESGFEEDYTELMYKNLYKNLLRDPDKFMNPHKAMEKQIADLIIVLSRHEWIDFSRPENQVVAKFFANATYTDGGRYKIFFHQLLLSMELDLRINSKHHAEWAKEKLLSQLPPCIAYDLALARKWRQCMTIEKFKTGGDPEQIKFRLLLKKAQVKALRRFARAVKWPSLVQVDDVLKESDPGARALENRSSDAMSYFTGMILPGATLPWLVMNALIDCDHDAGPTSLAALTHMFPHSGFQYRSTTYWSSTSIVGKVLSPTCREIAGWIGPVRPAPDLSRIQIARINQRAPKHALAPSDVASITVRSDPLGPPSSTYPTSDYTLPVPDTSFLVDTVRIEKLALKPISPPPSPSTTPSPSPGPGRDVPRTYDAAVQFAIAGRSWPLRLSYDVCYVSAAPCARGPHVLFFDYVFQAVKVDEILAIKDWGGAGGEREGELGDDEREKVLVVEACGVRDNEVLARAWCSHWGLGAIVADLGRTCMACAIREAYAACLNVVILVETESDDDDQ